MIVSTVKPDDTCINSSSLPSVGMSHKTHLKGDTSKRYFGYKLAIGQQRKKPPPPINETTFMQNVMSANRANERHAAKKTKELAVFLGTFHA